MKLIIKENNSKVNYLINYLNAFYKVTNLSKDFYHVYKKPVIKTWYDYLFYKDIEICTILVSNKYDNTGVDCLSLSFNGQDKQEETVKIGEMIEQNSEFEVRYIFGEV